MATTLLGGCRCGAVRYQATAMPERTSLCHCVDCQRNAGAPVVAWSAFKTEQVRVTKGAAKDYPSSGQAVRSFCDTCGTGLFYRNTEILPGITDIQTATLDDPAALPPSAQIQTAEQIDWMAEAHLLPSFARWPGMD